MAFGDALFGFNPAPYGIQPDQQRRDRSGLWSAIGGLGQGLLAASAPGANVGASIGAGLNQGMQQWEARKQRDFQNRLALSQEDRMMNADQRAAAQEARAVELFDPALRSAEAQANLAGFESEKQIRISKAAEATSAATSELFDAYVEDGTIPEELRVQARILKLNGDYEGSNEIIMGAFAQSGANEMELKLAQAHLELDNANTQLLIAEGMKRDPSLMDKLAEESNELQRKQLEIQQQNADTAAEREERLYGSQGIDDILDVRNQNLNLYKFAAAQAENDTQTALDSMAIEEGEAPEFKQQRMEFYMNQAVGQAPSQQGGGQGDQEEQQLVDQITAKASEVTDDEVTAFIIKHGRFANEDPQKLRNMIALELISPEMFNARFGIAPQEAPGVGVYGERR